MTNSLDAIRRVTTVQREREIAWKREKENCRYFPPTNSVATWSVQLYTRHMKSGLRFNYLCLNFLLKISFEKFFLYFKTNLSKFILYMHLFGVKKFLLCALQIWDNKTLRIVAKHRFKIVESQSLSGSIIFVRLRKKGSVAYTFISVSALNHMSLLTISIRIHLFLARQCCLFFFFFLLFSSKFITKIYDDEIILISINSKRLNLFSIASCCICCIWYEYIHRYIWGEKEIEREIFLQISISIVSSLYAIWSFYITIIHLWITSRSMKDNAGAWRANLILILSN